MYANTINNAYMKDKSLTLNMNIQNYDCNSTSAPHYAIDWRQKTFIL